ncbi:hypothetical protein [Bradyrhizobium cenepequi]|uniref:hypothetical protein n=1 Tax=Bradyrhizobium cenepequi TaxID=2821403 RepID=UPI001CE29ECD|nr:hypothetical protein [Bradyrhizobium cenepequi]MCA6112483.1 hypothetical protein [Bradyrhizobium cenepequi]
MSKAEREARHQHHLAIAEAVPEILGVTPGDWKATPKPVRIETIRAMDNIRRGHAVAADKVFGREKYVKDGFYAVVEAQLVLQGLELASADQEAIGAARAKVADLLKPLQHEDAMLADCMAVTEAWKEIGDDRTLPEVFEQYIHTQRAMAEKPIEAITALFEKCGIDPVKLSRHILATPTAH